MKKTFTLLLVLITTLQFYSKEVNEYTKPYFETEKTANPKVDYSIWSMLLKKNIDTNGHVNYKNFKKDKQMFNKFLNILSNTKIDNNWTTNQKIAFWINVYNAFTIKLIINNYPLKSIKEIKKPWDIKFFKIDGRSLSLGDVEHLILRKEFNEPRIHFAINCASKSCPRIIQIPYEGKNLDKLLERQTKEYVNDSEVNEITENSYKLSKLFSWFSKDFRQAEGNVEGFISKYSKTRIINQKNKGFLEYNWELNEK